MRQKERVGLPEVAHVGAVVGHRGNQAQKLLRARPRRQTGVTNHALRNTFGIHATGGRQRTRYQQARNTHPKTAGDEFDAHQAAAPVQLLQQWQQLRYQCLGRHAAQWQQFALHPGRQAVCRRVLRRWQQPRNGLGKVPYGLVTLLEQPGRQCACSKCHLTQHSTAHHLARLAATEEKHRPRRVSGGRRAKVILHSGQFGIAAGGAVEPVVQVGKGFHGACTAAVSGRSAASAGSPVGITCCAESCASSSPYSVLKACASSPCSQSQRTITLT